MPRASRRAARTPSAASCRRYAESSKGSRRAARTARIGTCWRSPPTGSSSAPLGSLRASEAILFASAPPSRLLRRGAPRNDGGGRLFGPAQDRGGDLVRFVEFGQ